MKKTNNYSGRPPKCSLVDGKERQRHRKVSTWALPQGKKEKTVGKEMWWK